MVRERERVRQWYDGIRYAASAVLNQRDVFLFIFYFILVSSSAKQLSLNSVYKFPFFFIVTVIESAP